MSKLRQAAEELSRAWRGPSMSEMILAFHAMDAALAEDRLADYLPPKRDEQAKGKGMTGEEIIRLAREAGFNRRSVSWPETVVNFERFARLVAAAEREACAKMCDPVEVGRYEYDRLSDYRQGLYDGAENCAAAIRARVKK